MTSETVDELKSEIRELQVLLNQATDETKRQELKLQILGLQGQKLKSQIATTLFSAKMRKAGQIASSRKIIGINDN